MKQPNLDISPQRTRLIVWSLLYIMPIIGMTVDLVAPALPAISKSLEIDQALTKNTITLYLLGYPIGNFLTGIITDTYGRKRLIRTNLGIFIIISLLPAIFSNIYILLLTRLLQGVTLGSAAVLLRAIISDILPSDKIVQLGALIGTMWGLGPVFGPTIGGYLENYFGWKACFVFFSLITLPGFLVIYLVIPETISKKLPLKLDTIKANCLQVLSNSEFIGLTIIMGIGYSLIIAFHTSGPFLIQANMHYSAIFFGHLALILGVCFLTATFLCRYLLRIYKVSSLLRTTLYTLIIITSIALIANYYQPNNLYLTTIPSGIVFFAVGIIYPSSMGKGMSMFNHISGTSTAIMYLLNGIIVSLTSYFMSYINVTNSATLVIIYLSLIIICISNLHLLILSKQNRQYT